MYEAPILDDFTRANGALGGNWLTPFSYPTSNAAVIRGNRFAGATNGTPGGAYWNATARGPQQHRVTYQGTVSGAFQDFYIGALTIPTGGGNPGNGILMDVTPSQPRGVGNACCVQVLQMINGVGYDLGSHYSSPLVAGDIFAFSWLQQQRRILVEVATAGVVRSIINISDKANSSPDYLTPEMALFPCLAIGGVIADNMLLDDWGFNALPGGFVGEGVTSWTTLLKESKLPT